VATNRVVRKSTELATDKHGLAQMMEKSLEPCDCLGAIYGFASGSGSRQFVRKRKYGRRRPAAGLAMRVSLSTL
jgi:hypothetical protein